MREKIACIYAIINTVNSRRYVGSTSDVKVRWSGHLSMLRRGVHENKYLQRSWTKHGEEAFLFTVIERCEVPELHVREQYHLDACQPNVYNRGSVAASPARGLKWSAQQRIDASNRKASNATKALLQASWSEKRKARTHCKYGHQWTAETTKDFYREDGSISRRECRACRIEKQRLAYAKYSAERGPDPRIGKPLPDHHKQALKLAWQREDHPLKKRGAFSSEHRAKLTEAWVQRRARKSEVA